MDLIDPSVRLSYLAAGEMGPLQIQSQAFDTSTAYEQVDTGWFWSVESGSIAVQTQEHTTAADQEEWLVRLTAESLGRISSASDLQAFLDPGGLGLDVVAGLGLPGLVLVRADTAITDVDSHLRTHSGVAYFEPNQDVATDGAIPDDPRFGDLYGLHNTGQSGGRVDADIDAVEAWQYTTGSRSIAVGVIDTGIDMTHPDLYRNVWINQAEIPSGLRASLSDVDGDGRITFVDVNAAANRSFSADRNGNGFIDARDLLEDSRWADGLDSDGNTFRDDLFGWDFVNNDNDPSDDQRHGTHVAGTIGAIGNDGFGVVGVSRNVTMIGLKFLSSQGSGSTANAVRSVNYATMMRQQGDGGIRVTNNSWGGAGYSQSLKDAIDAGGQAGIMFVAAAGNSNANLDQARHYPASYASPAIVAVAATDHNDNRAGFSNYGSASVHLGAPGSAILSTVPGRGHASLSGTSMAAPHVAGAVALAASANPGATVSELKEAVLASVDPIPALSGRSVTGGRLNAARLIEMVGLPGADITLSGDSVAENAVPGTLVGTFSVVSPSDSGIVFSLEPGAGDNALFVIEGAELRTSAALDHEAKSDCMIRVQAADVDGGVTTKTFTIQVVDQPEPPTALTLTGGRVARTAPIGTTVGTLATNDPDVGDSLRYELVDGEGDADNASFTITGNALQTAEFLDFTGRTEFAVRVRATDSTGQFIERRFAITEFVIDRFGFDRLVIEAFQAGSTLDLEDLQVKDLASGEVVYANSFDAGHSEGLTLTHWEDRGAVPRFDPSKTRVVDGRLRLESTGFGRNGSGGYDSRSRATLDARLPENFEVSFTLYKHQWYGHVHVHITPESLGMPEWIPQSLEGLGGFATNIQGGQINFAKVVGSSGETRNLLDPPGAGTTGPYLQTDVRYRIVKQDGTFKLYVQDQLRASTDALVPVAPAGSPPTDILITSQTIAENAPVGTAIGTLSTVDPDEDESFTYRLVSGDGDDGNVAFAIEGDVLVTAAAIDFEAQSTYSIRVQSTDSTGLLIEKEIGISVADVNEAPTSVTIANAVEEIIENADTREPILLGNVVVSDDALGVNTIGLVGEDADSFTVVDGQLFLKAGVNLDRSFKPRYAISVQVEDTALESSQPVSVAYNLEVAPVVTTWTYGFRHVNEAGADTHLVESVAMRKYREWGSNPITYWGPTTNGVEGRLVYRFDFPVEARDVRMRVALPSWDYMGSSDNRYTGSGRGAWAIEASADGQAWVTIRNNLEPRNWGEKWSMDGPIPAAAIDGRTLFVRMRFLVESSPNTSYTNAQFGRSTATATANVFEVEASLAVNRRPTDILLAGGGLTENDPIGTLVGSFSTVDPDEQQVFTYELVDGEGDTDNGFFAIEGDRLITAGTFDYESRDHVEIRVRSTDGGGLAVERSFVMPVLDVNEPPVEITIDRLVDSLPEDTDTSAAIPVATVAVVDDSLGENVVSLSGKDANAFELSGNQLVLKAGAELDYESTSVLTVELAVTDPSIPQSDPVAVAYSLPITDVAEATIVLSNSVIEENRPVGTAVGNFSRTEELEGQTPLNLFYSPEDGRMWLGNTTSEPLAIQSVTVTSPGQRLTGDEATMPDAPFQSSNYAESAPFGLYSEIFFASFNGPALDLAGGETWDFGSVAEVGLSGVELEEYFETDPAIDDEPGDRSGQFLYSLSGAETVSARLRGQIRSTASDYTYELVAGPGDGDNSLFVIDGQTLLTSIEFDFEERDTYSIRLRSSGHDAPVVEEAVTVTVADVNEAPTAIRLIDAVTEVAENTDTTSRIPVASIVVDDDALGSHEISILGDDADAFEVEGATLFLRAGTILDFEAQPTFAVTLQAVDDMLPGSSSVQVEYSLAIGDVNEAPRSVAFRNTTERLPEEWAGPLVERVMVAEVVVDDDALGTNEVEVGGADAAFFELDGNTLFLKAGVTLDYEMQEGYQLVVRALDASVPDAAPVSREFRLAVEDLNESPTGVMLTNVVASLPESTATLESIRVADIEVLDDALGTNSLSMSGPDAASFEIVDSKLFLRAGVTLDYGLKSEYSIFVTADDPEAVDRTAQTPLTIMYDADSGAMKLSNTTSGPLAIQSVAIVSPTRSLSGTEAKVPEALFTVLNTSDRGLYGMHSEIFVANVGSAVLTLGASEAWDFGPIAEPGLNAGGLQAAFATDPEADPDSKASRGRFLYSLLEAGEGGETSRGVILAAPEAAFTLVVTNDPEFSGREYIDVPDGEIRIDETIRDDGRQLIKRGNGTLVLAAANRHSGGTRVEEGLLVARDVTAVGTGTLDVRDNATVSLDIGTERMAVSDLAISAFGRIDVGFGGLRLSGQAGGSASLKEWLLAGRGSGDWRGYGITSSAVTDLRGSAVGHRVFGDGSASIAWAAFGDSNLDGRINSSDINMILGAGKFGRVGSDAGWWQGDYNYDGRVNSQDLNLLLSTGVFNNGSYFTRVPSGPGTGIAGIELRKALWASYGQDSPGEDG